MYIWYNAYIYNIFMYTNLVLRNCTSKWNMRVSPTWDTDHFSHQLATLNDSFRSTQAFSRYIGKPQDIDWYTYIYCIMSPFIGCYSCLDVPLKLLIPLIAPIWSWVIYMATPKKRQNNLTPRISLNTWRTLYRTTLSCNFFSASGGFYIAPKRCNDAEKIGYMSNLEYSK